MPRKWQVWGQPDGTLVWVPAPDEPPTAPPPPPPAAAAGPPNPSSPGGALIEETLGLGGDGGSRVQSMADLLVEVRSKLLEGDRVDGATDDSGKGRLFCTGSKSSVASSERARVLVQKEEDKEDATNSTKQPFNNHTCAEAEPSKSTDVPLRGRVLGNSLLPIFQTGSGNIVSLREGSIEKARALLEENKENTAGARQPIFRTGMGRSIPVSRGSIDKARAVIEGQTIANEGDVERVDVMEHVPLFQTGSGRAVSIWSERSVEKSSTVIMDEGAENIGQRDAGGRLPIFQTGLGRPVAVKQSSVQKAKTVLEEEDAKRSDLGNGDTRVCALSFQTETPKSVLMSSSLIMNDRTVTPEGSTAWQAEENNKVGDHLPLFQTGSGRVVAVSKSSIKRASAILEPRNIAKELEEEAHLDDGCAPSLFKTGLGRSVLTSKNSKEKAHIVLEAEEDVKRENPMVESGAQFILENGNSSHNASIPLEQRKFANKGYEDCGSPFPMFQTGSGKSVLVSARSMRKAKAVLEEEVDANKDKHRLINTEKHFPIFDSPVKTSSTRTVNVSSLGVSRAATLLGLEENTLSTQFFGHVGEKLGTKITVERENPECRLGVASGNTISVDSHKGFCPPKNRIFVDRHEEIRFSKSTTSDPGEHSIRFSSTGGRSMAISSDALRRAKSLLGELEDPQDDSVDRSLASASKEKLQNSTIYPGDEPDVSHISRSIGYALPDTPATEENANRLHLERECCAINEIPKVPRPPSRCLPEGDNVSDVKYNTRKHQTPSGALVDITNYIDPYSGNTDHCANGKRIMGGRNSISPFKRPRSSRFITPMKTSKLASAGESKLLSAHISPCGTKLSAFYPFQHQRKTYNEYFGGPPCFIYLTEYVTDDVKFMDPKRAEKYKFQHMGTGADDLQKMLLTCGASLSYATKEWVINHYKWIVWKLASLERCYPTRAGGKFLTVANVFEELKYRYDREVNHGHRSAIKKILEGNASPSLMMVLCISAIYSSPDLNNNKMEVDKVDTTEEINDNKSLSAANKNIYAKVELTDGWYSLDASLDVALSEQLEKRKLFLGQKLRIWGASLCGWSGPVSFSEASGTVKLMLHINGTYRARWNESLGFCKRVGLPLAFNCIKASGGKVPRTLVGVTRIYPVMYRERLHDGHFIVRSERMERKALQLYQQRVSKIAEDILFEQQENCDSTDDNDEGAKICKMLERAAEPEAIIESMTSEQLMHFSSYKEKQKVVLQNKVMKKVEKALEVADLSSRDVTPFLKVRVVGLVSKDSTSKDGNKEGLITIWNPTEMQKDDLVEGQVYSVTGLMPSNYCTTALYMHARGSSTMWKCLASSQTTNLKPFYTPRKAIELLKFGEVPLSSEFDIAGVILHVGTIYLCSNQKKQWLFLTDGSKFISGQKSEDLDCLLAVSVSSPTTVEDSALFSYALNGNIVGFSNLVKRQKDQMRQIWVAEATESSTFTLSHEIPTKSHLKEAATSAERWASRSYHKIQELRQRILYIVGDSGG